MSKNLAYHGDDVSAAYIHEKSGYVIEQLVDILQTIEDQDIPLEEKEKLIHGYVEAALWDALKIISSTTDSPWDTQDCRLIANCGNAKEGWNAIKYKYSQDSQKPWYEVPLKGKKEIFYKALLKKRSFLKAEIAVRKELCKRIKPLLKEHRGEARTKINMVMDSYLLQDNCISRMNYLLDQINMNHISWKDFCLRFMANLDYLESKMDSKDAKSYIANLFLDAKKRREARMAGKIVEEYNPAIVPMWEYKYYEEHTSDFTQFPD